MDKNLRANPNYNPNQSTLDKTPNQTPFTQSNNLPSSSQKDDIIKKEFERLKQYNCSKNYLKLTTDKSIHPNIGFHLLLLYYKIAMFQLD